MGVVRKALAVLLLVLSASPLTAPFATCDLLDLLGVDGPDVPTVAALKPAGTSDQPVLVPAAVRPIHCGIPGDVVPWLAVAAASFRRQISLPLRL